MIKYIESGGSSIERTVTETVAIARDVARILIEAQSGFPSQREGRY